MKKLNLLIGLLVGLFFVSCSCGCDENEEHFVETEQKIINEEGTLE